MKIDQPAPPQPVNTPLIRKYEVYKTPISLALLTMLLSFSVAMAANKFGLLVLFVIPIVILLLVIFGQPDYGLAIFIFLTVTQTSDVAIEFHGAPSIAQPLAGLLITVILLRTVLYREQLLSWRRFTPVLAIYIFALFISMVAAEDFVVSSEVFFSFFKDALGGVIVVLLIQRPASFRQAIWALIIAGIFMGTISVFQAFTETYDNQYFGFGRWESQMGVGQTRSRLTGPYGNPNAYSQVMIVIFALALERLWHEKRSLPRFFAGWATIVTSLTIVFTYSRGGILTFVATLFVLFLQNRQRLLPLLLVVVLGMTLTQFLPSDYGMHISTLQEILPTNGNQVNDESFRGRLSENIAAWRMFLDDPILGVGLGNFKIQYQDYSRQIGLDSRRVPRTPASLYLEVLSEQGLVGAAAFILLLYTTFTGLIAARVQFSHAGMHDHSNLTMAMIAGFAGYMIQAAVKNSAYSNVFWILVGVSLSAAQVALFHSREKSELTGQR